MTESAAYVYVIFRPNGVPCYVGKGKRRRWLSHETKTHNRYLSRIVAMAKANGQELPKVVVRSGLTDDEAFEVEIALIKAIGRVKDGGPLVNMSDGGEGVRGWDEESREKLAALRRGKKLDPKTCAKMSASKSGVKKSPEHVAAQAAASRGRKRTPEQRARIAASRVGRRTGPISNKRREAIRVATLAYWSRRRETGDTSRPRPKKERAG